MNKLSSTLALATFIAIFAPDANALTHCTFADVPAIHFGRYDTFSFAPLDAAGSFSFECHGDIQDDVVVIELGRGDGSSFIAREMSNGTAKLAYNLYLDAAHTAIWGDGTGGSARLGPIRPQRENKLWFYGRIPARQKARVGTYTDTLTVTIVY